MSDDRRRSLRRSSTSDRIRPANEQAPVSPTSLTASAEILNATKIRRLPPPEEWMEECWHYYGTTPEAQFAVNWLQNAMSRCRIMAATRGRGGDEPIKVDGGPAFDLMEQFAGGTHGQSQILARSTVHLSVPGIGYLMGEPTGSDDGTDQANTWGVHSQDEVDIKGGRYRIKTGDGQNDYRVLAEDALAVRCWRPDARFSFRSSTPMRATLPVLRELELLTQHVEASGVSRLAGNGILFVPKGMDFAVSDSRAGKPTSFITELMDAMLTPITDREAASAVVPFVVEVEGEFIKDIQHMTFASPLDERALGLREEAIKRFAAGMDIPAEIILGLGDSNHWTAWQIEESALKLHVEPMLEAVCAGLTIGYLRPALAYLGVPNVDDYLVWYDTTELTIRPDRSSDAREAWRDGVIGDAAYIREIGLDETDKPTEDEKKKALLVSVLSGAPSLAPIIFPMLGIEAVFPEADPLPTGAPPKAPQDAAGGTAAPSPAGPPTQAATDDDAALLAAADGLVYRALERAGARLVNSARKAGVQSSLNAGALTHTSIPEAVRMNGVDEALAGAWERVPEIASRFDVDPHALTATLDDYVRGLIVSGWPHDVNRLSDFLGA